MKKILMIMIGALLITSMFLAIPAGTEEDFCEKHQLLEKDCPWCDPSLVEKLGWCKGHDMAEAFCFLCNPKLKAGFIAENDWCKAHGVPESQCKICNPKKPKVQESDKTNNPRRFKSPSKYCNNEKLEVKLKSKEFANAAGFKFITVKKQSLKSLYSPDILAVSN